MNNDSNLFPIRELSARTQVNTVTIRAWERRYGLLNPQRSAKGHRLYSEADITTINSILAYIARGVAISKIKPLLEAKLTGNKANIDNGDTHQIVGIRPQENEQNAHWQHLIDKSLDYINQFEPNQLGNHWHKLLTHYPVDTCHAQIVEPVFQQLQSYHDHGASLIFAQSELLRYITVRISARSKRKKNTPTVIFCAGHKTPVWPLALMALSVFDAGAKVVLIDSPCQLDTLAGLAQKGHNHRIVFYQDGVFTKDQSALVKQIISHHNHVLLLGTAPSLIKSALTAQHNVNGLTQLFANTKDCMHHLSSNLTN